MFVMSGWPRGAVDSTRCSVDALPGSGLLLTCLFACYIKGEGLAEGDAGETGEGKGAARKLEKWQKEQM